MDIIIPEIDDIVNFYQQELVEQIARETSFVERDSKFGGIEFLGIMTQGLFSKPDASLSQMAAMASEINPQLEISDPGVHQRIDDTGISFLKRMLKEALELSAQQVIDSSIPSLLSSFRRIYLLDSTSIPIPENLADSFKGSGGKAQTSGMKLQLMLDYQSGNYVNVLPAEGIQADSSYIMEAIKLVDEGDLILNDLGYFNKKALFELSEKGAYFLSRLHHQVGLHQPDESGEMRKFDLLKELRKAMRNGICSCEFELWLKQNKDDKIKVRVIAYRMPDDVAAQRRRRVRRKAKKTGYTPTKRYLFLLGWGLYLTNVPQVIWPTEVVGVVYRLRWQIELVFKSWKSYHGLTDIKGEKRERIECFIYGRLIMMVIIAHLYGSMRRYLWKTKKRELSFLKTVRHFQIKAFRALSLMVESVSFTAFLRDEYLSACRLCMMELRKRPSTVSIIRSAGQRGEEEIAKAA